MARSNAVMKRTTLGNGATAVVTWAAIDGTQKLELDLARIPKDTIDALMLHGVYAKVGDGAAKSNATTAEKFDAMREIAENLLAGRWKGERGPVDSDLIDALTEHLAGKKTEAEVTAWVAAMSAVEKTAMRAHKDIKKILERQTAEKVKKSGVNVEDVLKKFMS